MKLILLFTLPLILFMQAGSCGDDTSDDGFINDTFVTFLGTTNDANGGCNIESMSGTQSSCTYAGSYNLDGQGYAISVSHTGICRSATFQLRDNINQPSNALFIVQITEDGVAVETFTGFSGTVDLVDAGTITSMAFNGTVLNTETGDEQAISGYMECPI